MLAQTGIPAKDVVAVGAVDPGLRIVDFENKTCFRSLTNAVELASQTSISVIDRFPERDIADGGLGTHLFALAYWFLLGDRNPKVANENRLFVFAEEAQIKAYFLPASDGLDAVLPRIEFSKIDQAGKEIQLSEVQEFDSKVPPGRS